METARIKSQDVNSFSAYWSGYFAASGSYSQSGDVVRNYILTNSSGICVGSWNSLYTNATNYNYVEGQLKSKLGYDYWVAVCKIMKAYDFQHLVDFYGNIPYKQASVGFEHLSPTYDTDKDIYASLSAQLDTAVMMIKNAPSNAVALPNTVDVMFSSNMTLWAQLANTLRLRLLLHQSKVTSLASYIAGEIGKITSNGYGYLSQDALIQPGYTMAANLQNPFWESNGLSTGGAYQGRDYNRVSEFSLDFFKGTSDPRLDYVVRAPGDLPGTNLKDAPYVAIPFGALPTTNLSSAYTCGFGPGIMPSPSAPVVFLSASQSLFLQAEAAQLGWIASDPKTLYQQGITESFRLIGVPDYSAAATSYYTSGNVQTDWSTATTDADKLTLIITQKWASMYATDAAEAWADMRRYNNPLGVPLSVDPGRVSSIQPIRLLYPQSEYNNNTKNVEGQGTISQFTSRIFWDVD